MSPDAFGFSLAKRDFLISRIFSPFPFSFFEDFFCTVFWSCFSFFLSFFLFLELTTMNRDSESIKIQCAWNTSAQVGMEA